MRIHIVINALSGRGQGRVLAHQLRRFDPILLIPAEASAQLGAVVAAEWIVDKRGVHGFDAVLAGLLREDQS